MRRKNICLAKASISVPVKFVHFFFLTAMLFLIFGHLSQAQAATRFATLDKVHGEVVVLNKDGSPLAHGKDGLSIKPGQIIKTVGPNSETDIILFNGSRVRLLPDSAVKASVKSKEGKHHVQIDLISGKIFNVVQKAKKGGHYVVKAKSSVAGFKGKVFSAEIHEGQSVFMVQDGKLKVINPQESGKKGIYVSSMQ